MWWKIWLVIVWENFHRQGHLEDMERLSKEQLQRHKIMLIKAEQKNADITARKIRPLAAEIKKMAPSKALVSLDFVHLKAATLLSKVIKQATANAVNVKNLEEKNLRFQSIIIGEGPTLKRWRASSRGRASTIFKRTCHIKVLLKDIKGGKIGKKS